MIQSLWLFPCQRTPGDLLCGWLCFGEASTESQAGVQAEGWEHLYSCRHLGGLTPMEGPSKQKSKQQQIFSSRVYSLLDTLLSTFDIHLPLCFSEIQ